MLGMSLSHEESTLCGYLAPVTTTKEESSVISRVGVDACSWVFAKSIIGMGKRSRRVVHLISMCLEGGTARSMLAEDSS